MNKIASFIFIGFTAIVAVGSFWMMIEERRSRKKLEKEVDGVKNNAEKAAELMGEANKTKSDARTGNHSADIEYMAGKLHDYSRR